MAHVAAAKTLVTGTVSSFQKKVDKLLTDDKDSQAEKTEKKERKNNEKEQQKKEKERRKEAELKAKHEKEVLDRQAQRAELRLQMRSKYGLRGDKKDEDIITARKSQNESSEEDKSEVPAWMKDESKTEKPEDDASDSQAEYNPFESDNLDKSAESEYEQQLKKKDEEKKEAKEQEKRRKKEEKARKKQEEKESKEREKRETKERKGRIKQNMDQWKEKKDAGRSIVDEHQRRQNLYEKYNVKPQVAADETKSTNPFDDDESTAIPFDEPRDSGMSSPTAESETSKDSVVPSDGADKKECILM